MGAVKSLALSLLVFASVSAQAQQSPQGKPLTALPQASLPLGGSELTYVLQGGQDKKTTVGSFGAGAGMFLPLTGGTVSGLTTFNGGLAGVFTVPAGKAAGISNSITFTGTDGTTFALPSVSTSIPGTGSANTWAGLQTFNGGLAGALTVPSGKAAAIRNSLSFTGTDGTTFSLPSVSTALAGLGSPQTWSGLQTFTGGLAGNIAIPSTKAAVISNSLTFTGTDGTSFLFPSTSDTVAGLGQAQTFTQPQQFNGNVTVGNGTGGPQITLNGGVGNFRQLNWRTSGQNRWQLDAFNDAEGGLSDGSSLVLEAFSDTNVANQLWNAKRSSGPYGTGRGYFTNLAPFNMATPLAVQPGGTYGTLINFGNTSDAQPIATLGANPLATTASSNVVTVTWPNCCGATSGLRGISGPLYNVNFQTWVNLLGATAVGGITPTGWLQVQSIIDANTFTVNGPGNASSSATGGGSSVTAQPSFATTAHYKYATATSGAAGFPIENLDIFVANPSFYGGTPLYQHDFKMTFSPNDTSHGWGTFEQESDLVFRGIDSGYQPNIYGQFQTSVGKFLVAYGQVPSFAAGGGTAGNWQTAFACASENVTPQVGFYDCYNNGHDSLVGAAVDPTGHGGVANVVFGSYDTLAAPPFATTISTGTVTVKFAGLNSWLQAATNGTNVHFYKAYSLNGVTWGPGDYAITCAAGNCAGQSQFTITGSGSASATGTGGSGGEIVSFATLVPYGVTDIFGEFKHGITTTTHTKFDDGLIINTQPGNGVGWNDGTGTASVTGTEITTGHVSVDLVPTAGDPINAKGPLRLNRYTIAAGASQIPACVSALSGAIAYVTDFTGSPTYNGAIGSGGGSTGLPVACDGASWTQH